MDLISDHHKIKADHLARLAFVYVRQSTLKQVQRNVGSTARQYDLSERARELGWQPEQLVIIDQDQAQSGASSTERTGFQHLVAEVGLGHAGAVLSLEASRLARSSSAWYQLLEICALTHTLVIDEEGVYDPGQYNDRLLLGFKGTMSEAELHWIHSRLNGGKLELARQGKLRFHLPTGLSHDLEGRIIKDPDEAVQASIQQVFDQFAICKTARGVVLYFREHQLLLPTRLWGTARAGETIWKPPTTGRILAILHNPFYAGAYVYGQTQRVPQLPGRGILSSRQIQREIPAVVIHNHHDGYLSWEQYQHNQQQLDDNCNGRNHSRRGAVREGVGLLQGIVLCGCCGRRMKVRYQEDKIRPTYVCDGPYQSHGDPWCQAIRGQHVDTAIAEAVLAALQPAEMRVAWQALDEILHQQNQADRQHELQLEHARYEADLARRRFMQVEPENRLVARTLERDWNVKLNVLDELQRLQASQPSSGVHALTDEERQQMLYLVQNFPVLWYAPSTTHAERKQLVRALIADVTLTRHETTIHVGIRWHSGAVTELNVVRGTLRTADIIITHIRQLAQQHRSDEQIATFLNENGFYTARRHTFTAPRVRELRSLYHISRGDARRPDAYPTGQRTDGRYTVRKASELLNWSIPTIHKWCKQGILDAVQEGRNHPIWVKLTPEIIAEYRNLDNPWDPNRV